MNELFSLAIMELSTLQPTFLQHKITLPEAEIPSEIFSLPTNLLRRVLHLISANDGIAPLMSSCRRFQYTIENEPALYESYLFEKSAHPIRKTLTMARAALSNPRATLFRQKALMGIESAEKHLQIKTLLRKRDFKNAMLLAKKFSNTTRYFVEIAFEQARYDLHGALENGSTIFHIAPERNQLFCDIALLRTSMRDPKGAEISVNKITSSTLRIKAFMQVFEELKKGGYESSAERTLKISIQGAIDTTESHQKITSLLTISKTLIKHDYFELWKEIQVHIQKAAQGTTSPILRADVYKEILIKYAACGKITDAISLLPRITDPYNLDCCLSSLAIAYAKNTLPGSALAKIKSMKHADMQTEALNKVSTAFAEKGNLPLARKINRLAGFTAQRIVNPYEQVTALIQNERVLLRFGGSIRGIEYTLSIPDLERKISSLLLLAKILAERGERKEVFSLLTNVDPLIENLELLCRRDFAHFEFCRVLQTAGLWRSALDRARAIASVHQKAQLSHYEIKDHLENQDLESALKIVSHQKNIGFKVEALLYIADHLLKDI